jgi:hypothetical protein
LIEASTVKQTMASLIGINPTPADLARLERSWITKELAEQALIRRVNASEGAGIVGRKEGDNCAGLIFPYLWPGEDSIREYRLRRDTPEIQYEGTTRKEVGKYLSPPGRGNMLYFAPGTQADWLTRSDLPVVITEGEKKTLSLFRLAHHEIKGSSEDGRFLPIGLSGAWNWRGSIGKENGPNGERLSVKGIIPDFHRVSWTGRRVYILFDSNVKTNDNVRAARTGLARALSHEFGAEVRFVELPSLEDVNGIDDYLAIAGPAKALALVKQARAIKIDSKNASQRTVIERLCNDAQFFHTHEKRGFSSISVGDHREVWPIRSKEFRAHIVKRYFNEEGTPPSAQAIEDALSVFEAKSLYEGPIAEVGVRLMKHEEAIYLDLGDEHWNAAKRLDPYPRRSSQVQAAERNADSTVSS